LSKNKKMPSKTVAFFLLCVLAVMTVSGCAALRPRHPNNICEIFRENKDWYENAYAASRKWNVPIPLMMAIIYRESGFNADARPPRTTCLLIFPGPRPSSAYGYSQALDQTWKRYKQSAGNRGADRDDFGDAIDFVGWYCNQSRIECGIPPDDAYHLYLAYHEGQTGFSQRTYENKPRLKQIAESVKQQTLFYKSQLDSCEHEFRKPGGCCLWPF
jgi:hypothetical protein